MMKLGSLGEAFQQHALAFGFGCLELKPQQSKSQEIRSPPREGSLGTHVNLNHQVLNSLTCNIPTCPIVAVCFAQSDTKKCALFCGIFSNVINECPLMTRWCPSNSFQKEPKSDLKRDCPQFTSPLCYLTLETTFCFHRMCSILSLIGTASSASEGVK